MRACGPQPVVMVSGWRLALLFVRGRGIASIFAFGAAVVVAAWWGSPSLSVVPLDNSRRVLDIAWASCLPAIVAVPAMASPNAILERCYPMVPIARLRVGWFIILAVSAPGAALFAAAMTGNPLWTVAWFARNHIMMLSIGGLATVVVPSVTAWAIPTIYVLSCWFLGTTNDTAAPAVWALPNHPPSISWILVLTGLLAAGAGVAHYLRPGVGDN